MPSWTFSCWSCGRATEMIDKVTRADVCPHCGADMHSCRNCAHWAPDNPERCCDDSFPKTTDPESANFSNRFTPRTSPLSADNEADKAKKRLDSLFSDDSD